VGVAIDTLADMETLFEGIPLDKVSTSMTINSTAATLLAMYIAVGQKQGLTESKPARHVHCGWTEAGVDRGMYIYPPKPSMRMVTDISHHIRWHPYEAIAGIYSSIRQRLYSLTESP
jgi:methylmalonyl-CoA mutase N-terminal domain/subunit